MGLCVLTLWAMDEVSSSPPPLSGGGKIVGRYCLIKPGAGKGHCEGSEAPLVDPVLAAIEAMKAEGGGLDSIDLVLP